MSKDATPQAWQQVLDHLDQQVLSVPQLRLVVCGCKGTGKSTFARLLLNRLAPAGAGGVAYLDTDCGQAEFTPPGLVSLHLLSDAVSGQPHQHLRQADSARFVGELSCAGDPVRYVAAVEAVLADLPAAASQHEQAAVPLIVNTAGWVKGIGLEVLTGIFQAVQPTHVVMLQTGNPAKDLPATPFWAEPRACTSAAVLPLPAVVASDSQSPGSARRLPPAESRALSWLAFAKACCGEAWQAPASECDSAAFSQAADQLAAQVPYQAACVDLTLQVLHMHVEPDLVPQVANCSVVGLIANGEAGTGGSLAQQRCLGLGIVRSIDPEREVVHLLTPVPAPQLQQVRLTSMVKVNLLQLGRLELPPALLHGRHVWSPYLAMGSLTAVGTGAGHVHPRTDLARPGRIALA